jgi:hypothetical protein
MNTRLGWKTLLLATLGLSIATAACTEERKRKKGDDDDGEGASGAVGGAGGEGAVGGEGGGTHVDPDGPQFLSFGTNVTTLYEQQSATFTAVLTDPDGVDDVIGGSLKDANGGVYGAFSTSGQEGSYEMTVYWDEINQIGSIDFDYGAAQARGFIAEFWDAGGHISSTEITLDLACTSGYAGCNGTCYDTENDIYNCGACGTSCYDDLCTVNPVCGQGSCGGTPMDCSWMGDGECQTGSCNASTGSCEADNAPNGTSCDDGDVCTEDDECNAGSCEGTPVGGGGGVLFAEDFSDNTAGWTLGTDWAIGAATASSGHGSGNADPANDHSATADDGVAGVAIGGNAPTTVHGFYYLTSPAVNANVSGPVTLTFYRWLNSDYTPYMQNVVEAFNGTSWVQVWASGASPGIADAAWGLQTYDLTAYKNAALKVRFGFNVGSSAIVVSSWNVDDVQIATTAGVCD